MEYSRGACLSPVSAIAVPPLDACSAVICLVISQTYDTDYGIKACRSWSNGTVHLAVTCRRQHYQAIVPAKAAIPFSAVQPGPQSTVPLAL